MLFSLTSKCSQMNPTCLATAERISDTHSYPTWIHSNLCKEATGCPDFKNCSSIENTFKLSSSTVNTILKHDAVVISIF